VRECLACEVESELSGGAARERQRLQHRSIVLRIDNYKHVAEVLRRSPDETWTADVDLLDELVEAHFLASRGLHERIRLTTTRSTRPMPWARAASRSSVWLRRARMPP
jgi:hypothetical protein